MFCEWDKDLELKVVKQLKGCNTYELDKKKPYTIQRLYNGSIVGHLESFANKSMAELFLLDYAKKGP